MNTTEYLAQVRQRIDRANGTDCLTKRQAARFALGYDAETLLRMVKTLKTLTEHIRDAGPGPNWDGYASVALAELEQIAAE